MNLHKLRVTMYKNTHSHQTQQMSRVILLNRWNACCSFARKWLDSIQRKNNKVQCDCCYTVSVLLLRFFFLLAFLCLILVRLQTCLILQKSKDSLFSCCAFFAITFTRAKSSIGGSSGNSKQFPKKVLHKLEMTASTQQWEIKSFKLWPKNDNRRHLNKTKRVHLNCVDTFFAGRSFFFRAEERMKKKTNNK